MPKYNVYQRRLFYRELGAFLSTITAGEFYASLSLPEDESEEVKRDGYEAFWVLDRLSWFLTEFKNACHEDPSCFVYEANLIWTRPFRVKTEDYLIEMELEVGGSRGLLRDAIRITALHDEGCFFAVENLLGNGPMSFSFRWPIHRPKDLPDNPKHYFEKRVEADSFIGFDIPITPKDTALWWEFEDVHFDNMETVKARIRLAVATHNLTSKSLEKVHGHGWLGDKFRVSNLEYEDPGKILSLYGELLEGLLELHKRIDPDFDDEAYRNKSSRESLEDDDVFTLLYLYAHHANEVKIAFQKRTEKEEYNDVI